TQLMPTTAKAVARQLKMQGVTVASLLVPDINIRLGSWQLGSLLKKFNNNKIYAVASYNAGSHAVERWRQDKPSLEIDEWVEEIPIAETRGSVKRVLRSYNTYQLLYQRRPPSSTVTSKRTLYQRRPPSNTVTSKR
ncbi:MAG: lytic transglycosylase domain-containing protein, partial [Myxococcaceae bacterium]